MTLPLDCRFTVCLKQKQNVMRYVPMITVCGGEHNPVVHKLQVHDERQGRGCLSTITIYFYNCDAVLFPFVLPNKGVPNN